MPRRIYFISHPDVLVDPDVPVPRWPLSERGRERMRLLLTHPWVGEIATVHCSDEQKAIDGAAILAGHLGIPFEEHADLGENDRSSTGYLARDEFQATADQFFAKPNTSVRGWERAVDAQRRIVEAVSRLVAVAPGTGPIAIVSHGGVGTLLLCHVLGEPISRRREQPGSTGGNYFVFELPPPRLVHDWAPIEVT